ncbi:MAG: hypothetical protein HFI38_08175 [Lachnospiraceae bacterium]|jgi:hypothetical protein|nr:hypothetical protein [Lachnospiraceae bacterium]
MKSRWRRSLTALLLAVCAVLALSVYEGAVLAAGTPADITKSCSVTVSPGTIEDLENAGIVIDVYKVADAKEDGVYDTYGYTLTGDYRGMEGLEAALSDLSGLSNEDWRSLAAGVAEFTFREDQKIEAAQTQKPANTRIEGLESGLYLLVARSESLTDREDYITSVPDKEDETKENLATVAYSSRYVYTFFPELISLPGKEPVPGQEPGSLIQNTSNPGEWLYDMSVVLKPAQSPRYGDLEITKILESYENSGPATFVFRIEAELDGEKVYSDVAALTFDAAGEKTIRIEGRIPIGAQVTVTEVYHGSAYTQVGQEPEGPLTLEDFDNPIEDTDSAGVTFRNRYDEQDRKGYGVVNRFSKDENGVWTWDNTGDNEAQ